MSKNKYQDIARIIEDKIDLGHYQPGSKLPTHRALAEELGTTAVTVAKAYQLLASENKIESHVGRGSYVFKNQALSQVIQSEVADDAFNFSILQPCLSAQLVELTGHWQNALSHPIQPELYGYSENTGLERHKEIGALWPMRFGLHPVNIEQVHLVCGAQHALSTLVQLYSEPGDIIAVEAQTYPGILSIASFLGRKVVAVEMDEEGVMPTALEAVCQEYQPKLTILLPSHQNPTGVTMSTERRQEVAIVISRHEGFLIEDDVYGFLNTQALPAISNYIPEKCFHISSLSKAISPGMRCAFIVSPKSQSSRLSAFIRAMVWLPSPLMFELASAIIADGKAFDMAEEQRSIASKRQIMASKVLVDYPFSSQSSSYHIWLSLPERWHTDHFSVLAKEQGILVNSASYFCVNRRTTNRVRVSLMAIETQSKFIAGLTKLSDLLASPQEQVLPF